MSALPGPDRLQQALAGLRHRTAQAAPAPDLIVVGAVGALGNAVLEQLLGQGGHGVVHVAVDASQSIAMAMRGVHPVALDALRPLECSPRVAAETAVVVFDLPRSRRGREDALFVPEPGQLPALAAWLRDCGVRSIVVVLPHAPMGLPAALKSGLANLDEQAVAALGWRHAVLVRPTRDAPGTTPLRRLQRLAQLLLAQLQFMVPQRERPLRAEQVARFVGALLRALPGAPALTRVAAPELLWDALHAADLDAAVNEWLLGRGMAPAPLARERM